MATNLFDIINPNFFGVLSGRNRVSNFLLITEISHFFGSQVTVERKRLIDYIAEQIKVMHIEDVGDDIGDEETYEVYGGTNQHNQKANIFITYLEKRGWLDRDRNQDFIDIVSRTDAYLEIFDSLMKLIQEETDAKEQSTALLSLYRNIRDFDYKNATTSVESIEIASKDLEKSILSINSKIKRFVDKAMSDSSLDEREILKRLTIDYQKLSAYISFHNLYTKNNPNKYSLAITNKIYDLQIDETMNQVIDDYCKTKGLKVEDESERLKAKRYIEQVYEKVLFQIETIEQSISDIAARNYSYTSSSVDRINFRLNNERDIKGDINNLLKVIKQSALEDEFETDFDFYSFDQTDNKSLFTARALSKIAPKETPFIKHEINPEALAKAEELIKQREMYSFQSVNKFVLEQLGERDKLLANELHVDNIEDFIKMMLIPVYSTNSSSSYTVNKLKNQTFDCLKYIVDNYEIIRRKEN
ncbi:MAG: hypothetical protein IKB70_14495 [Bacilli bacterium]|nr:hypothetical protein [Bacilli bacterium]